MDKLMELVAKKRKQLLLVQDFLRVRSQEAAQAQAKEGDVGGSAK